MFVDAQKSAPAHHDEGGHPRQGRYDRHARRAKRPCKHPNPKHDGHNSDLRFSSGVEVFFLVPPLVDFYRLRQNKTQREGDSSIAFIKLALNSG